MRKYVLYLKYIIRHKWFVAVECFKRGLYWRGLMHDMSKLLPSEFFPYVNYFYGEKQRKCCSQCIHLVWSCQCGLTGSGLGDCTNAEKCSDFHRFDDPFDGAWLLHQKRNPHHWQYWILRNDSGSTVLLPMPRKYMLEMVCDWVGAGKAIHGKNEVCEWYEKNREKILLEKMTRIRVEAEIGYSEEIPHS